MHRIAPSTARTLTALAAACASAAVLAGCYRHVVGVNGPGATNVEVHEANIGRDESVWNQPKPRPVERDSATWERLPQQ
jgi:hypothetical protein